MSQIQLKYGKTSVPFSYNENQFEILGSEITDFPLTDVEIGNAFDTPIDSKSLEELIQTGESVLFVVPDATRSVAAGEIVNLLIRRLIANGTLPSDIRIIFAVGIHRPVSDTEKAEILSPFIIQRIKVLEHNARSLSDVIRLGKTASGTPIELNRALKEHDHVIIVGGISFHYFAGFTGGRKLICPGLASARTISETHKLAFDFVRKTRQNGVGLGLLAGNPVHEEFVEVANAINPTFSVNTFTNERGEVANIFAGDWQTSHLQACESYAQKYTVKIKEKRDLVIVSCGGFPFDLNMIQAQKALEMASQACNEGGTIIFLAECADGLGRKDFLSWFECENVEKLADKLGESYQVNGQTAWSLLQKAERFKIKLISNLSEKETHRMRLNPMRELKIDITEKGYIVPFGSKFLISLLET